MAYAAKKVSQVLAHMAIGFGIMLTLTGSIVYSGMALLVEPVLNVLLLPFHERVWAAVQARTKAGRQHTLLHAGEKISQAGFHTVISFSVIYWATGSVAFGGVAAILEPICNIVLMPVHDRLWERIAPLERIQGAMAQAPTM